MASALYRPLHLIETPIVFSTIETAELMKYAANASLATKITLINEIADLCERVGADVRGIGLDGRIGRKFLHAGPRFGDPSFPRIAERWWAPRARHRRVWRSSRRWCASTTRAGAAWTGHHRTGDPHAGGKLPTM
jgi:hypothetical protein